VTSKTFKSCIFAHSHVAYAHVHDDGNVVEGKLVPRKCTTKIKIFSPVDRSDHRAIVLVMGAHNHPRPASTKMSRDGKELYMTAVNAVGATGATAVKVDRGTRILM
jgi:hypothetical protein